MNDGGHRTADKGCRGKTTFPLFQCHPLVPATIFSHVLDGTTGLLTDHPASLVGFGLFLNV